MFVKFLFKQKLEDDLWYLLQDMLHNDLTYSDTQGYIFKVYVWSVFP